MQKQFLLAKNLQRYVAPQFRFSKLAYGDLDSANIFQSIKPPETLAPEDVFTKLDVIKPMELYHQADEFSREALLYLANDLGWGMGLSILAISLGIKLAFGPIMMVTQFNGIKSKLLEPEMKNYQANVQRLSKQQDYKGVKACQKQFSQLRKEHGISNLLPLFSLAQIPVLMTWFFSLRYVSSMPDKFPGIKTDGFLWFKDLSSYDPYGVLPILSATFTFFNLSLNPNLQAGAGTKFARYYRYFRFFPFVSIPVVIFFPSAINLYWCTSALIHLLVASAARSEKIRAFAGIPKYLPGTILERQHQSKAQSIIKGVIEESMNKKKSISMASEQVATKGTQQVKILRDKPKKQKK